MKTIVFFQGSFDGTCVGHVRALDLAKSHGDILVVGLNTDALIEDDKNRKVILPYAQRKEIMQGFRSVDLVIPCDQEQALPYLMMLDADVFVLTEEWRDRHLNGGIAYMENKGGKVVFSPRWEGVMCCTDIRKKTVEVMEEMRSGK